MTAQDGDAPELPGGGSDLTAAVSGGSAALLAAIPALEAAKRRMLDRCAASLTKLDADAAELKAAIDAHVAKTKATVAAELAARVKALDAQADCLAVSAGQLSAAALVSDGGVLAQQMAKLAMPYRGPCVPTVCSVVSEVDGVLAALTAGFTRLVLAVDLTRSRMTPLDRMLVYGGDNAVQLVLRDDTAQPVTSLSTDDVLAWSEDAAGHVGGVAHGERDGELRVTLFVDDASTVEKVRLCASVAGTGGFTATVHKVSTPFVWVLWIMCDVFARDCCSA